MPKFPDNPDFVASVQQEIVKRLKLLCLVPWQVILVTRKQDTHVGISEESRHTAFVSESAVRRVLAKKFYRKHVKLDPLLLTREGLITDVVTKAIQLGFNRRSPPAGIWQLYCPCCGEPCPVDGKRCILKQCGACCRWFARDALLLEAPKNKDKC
jgi:hypothetical protein